MAASPADMACAVSDNGVVDALAIVPAAAAYAYKLHSASIDRDNSAGVHTSLDCSHVLIAVRSTPAIGVEAGQRCAIGSIDCDRRPREIEAVCDRIGVVMIPQAEWPALVRIPREDFGVPPSREIAAFPESCAP